MRGNKLFDFVAEERSPQSARKDEAAARLASRRSRAAAKEEPRAFQRRSEGQQRGIPAWINGINAGFGVACESAPQVRARPSVLPSHSLGLPSLPAPFIFPDVTRGSPAAQVQH